MTDIFKPEWFEHAQQPLPPGEHTLVITQVKTGKRYTRKTNRRRYVEVTMEAVGGAEDGKQIVSRDYV